MPDLVLWQTNLFRHLFTQKQNYKSGMAIPQAVNSKQNFLPVLLKTILFPGFKSLASFLHLSAIWRPTYPNYSFFSIFTQILLLSFEEVITTLSSLEFAGIEVLGDWHAYWVSCILKPNFDAIGVSKNHSCLLK